MLNVTYIDNQFCQNAKIKREIISNKPSVIYTINEKEYITICVNYIKINISTF